MPGPATKTLLATAVIVLLWAGMVGLIHYRGASEGTPNARIAAIAFGVAYGAIAISALMATLRPSPPLLVATGLALTLMALLGFSPIALPLALPGALLAAHGVNALSNPRPQTLLAMAAVVVLGIAALLALMLHQDPAEWQTATGGAGTSDLVTRTESLISLALSTSLVALSLAWVALASPRVVERP